MLRVWWYRVTSGALVAGIIFVCFCAAWFHARIRSPARVAPTIPQVTPGAASRPTAGRMAVIPKDAR